MEDLTAFLRARLDEDEQNASVAGGFAWRSGYSADRLLREVEAKRAMLYHHHPIVRRAGWPPTCGWDNHRWPCAEVLSWAAVYSDHPDYDPEWKP